MLKRAFDWLTGFALLALLITLILFIIQSAHAGPEFRELLQEEKADKDATHVVVFTHEDLTNATASYTSLFTTVSVAARQGVELVDMELVQAFANTNMAANNTLLVYVGDGSDPDRFLESTELNTNGTEVWLKYGTSSQEVYTAADTIDFSFVPPVTNSLSELNQGEVEFYLRIKGQ